MNCHSATLISGVPSLIVNNYYCGIGFVNVTGYHYIPKFR